MESPMITFIPSLVITGIISDEQEAYVLTTCRSDLWGVRNIETNRHIISKIIVLPEASLSDKEYNHKKDFQTDCLLKYGGSIYVG
jgi:hypothetical protein